MSERNGVGRRVWSRCCVVGGVRSKGGCLVISVISGPL